MYVVACSWRVRMKRMSFSSRSAAMAPYSWTPGRPNTTRTPSRCSCLASASPPVILGIVGLLGVLAELEAADLAAMHLVGTVGEPERAGVGPPEGQRELLADAAAAVHLHGAVEHAERHVRHRDLDTGNGLLGGLVADGVHHVRGVEHEQPRLVDRKSVV